jgi:hypothetical protein
MTGPMTADIYALLKRDAELLCKVLLGQGLPPPLLYDPEVNRLPEGHYRQLKSSPPVNCGKERGSRSV